jgi:uncharacterized membrane protein YqjE
MTTREKNRPITSLLTHVVSEVAYLLQTEIRLAKAEIGEKISSAAFGAGMIGGGAVLLLAGLIVLLFGAVQWLVIAGMPHEWAFLLVGFVVLAAGAGLAMFGLRSFKGSELMPNRTIEQVRADFSIVKEQAS